jgi:hypothetical protein
VLGDLYKRVKKEYKLPLNKLEKISEGLKRYYSSREREEYIKRICVGEKEESYSESEYKLYVSIYLENSILSSSLKKSEVCHYLDEGCICIKCKKKRMKVFEELKLGKKIEGKIQHNNNEKKIQDKNNKPNNILEKKTIYKKMHKMIFM